MDGNIIYDEYNIEFKITEELSRGGQGVVFRTTDENILIKIEFEKETESNNDESKKKYSNDLRNNEKFKSLRLLPISRNINITLPKSVLKEYVGYTMDILSDMESLEKVFSMSNPKQANDWTKLLLKSSEELSNQFSNYILTGGKRKRLIVFLEIAKILSNLHMNGLVYCDLSPNNVFVTSKGNYINTWLIDADNINYQEETLQNGFYTPRYGAPEVIKGKGCTFYSDSYTLAVMLFEELVNNHPFRGSAENQENDEDNWDNDEILDENTLTFEEKLHYGLLPWILDKEDDSNELKDSPFFNLLSEEILEKFDRTFSQKGKDKKTTRTSSFEWVEAIAQELDKTVKCKYCEMEYLENENEICPWCDTKNKILKIISYNENGKKIWNFYQEIEYGIKKIPLRMIENVSLAHTTENIFSIRLLDKNKLKIFDFYYEYDFFLIDENEKNRILGSYITEEKKQLKILVEHNKTKRKTILEVEIK